MSAHKNFFQTSDFLLYITVLPSLILEWLIPTTLYINRAVSISVGILIMMAAWALIFTTKYQFKKHSQKTGPNNETTILITSGLFAYSRNPIYLGVVFLAPALGLIVNSVWLILAIFPLIFLVNYVLIFPEEKYLVNKFGEKYANYMNSVRRWI